ncbi:MAG TPA: SdpI family protein [Gemmatimonadales bacterium]|nr:SdpI family protein [Gemmatimonadales bacterium]
MRSRWLGFGFAILAGLASIWAYPQLPERIATHWSFSGQPNGYSSRAFAAWFAPAMIAVLALLFQILPKIDPKRRNYEKFGDAYWLLANVLPFFLLCVHVMLLANGLGYPAPVGRLIPVGVGLLFIVLGNYLPRIQPNWFVGVRTPWTMSSDTVWRQTHRTAGWVFVTAGFVMLTGAVLPRVVYLPLLVVTVVLAPLVPIVQSYILWKREQPHGP